MAELMAPPVETSRMDPFAPAAAALPWYVLHTRSRQEKAVSSALAARRVPHFLPLARQVRFYGKRKATVDMPLFPGYVFFRGERDEAFACDRNNRLVQILRVEDPTLLEEQLDSVRIALAAEVPLDPCPHLVKGRRVEVRSGPMRGMKGVVEGRGRQVNRIYVQVDMLGQAVSAEIDANLLDVIEE